VPAHAGTLAVLWLLVAGCAGWALVRGFGLDRGRGAIVLLVSFTPYAAACSVVVCAAALAARAWWAAAVAGLAAAALLACVLPRSLADGGSGGAGPRLRVLSSNLLIGGADASRIVDLVRAERVDLLAVQEFTPDAQRRLEEAGLASLLPYRVSYPVAGTAGSGLFSRYPLRDDGPRAQPSGFTQARATVSVPGAAPVAVESAHPCAPSSPSAAGCWRTDLAGEPHATPNGPVRILAGDFNATLDHAEFRTLIATGYRDAAAVRGKGLAPTWPFYGSRHVPPVTIDHILADRRIGVTRFAVFNVPRSDHHAVLADLVLPKEGPPING
jgi:endonuclease/exonuclease/phosphatase family metal-dependent hydrolase